MTEDPEASIIDVKDTSVRLKIEIATDNIHKIMIMQKRSKEDWKNILEKKIKDQTSAEIIQDVDNLIPDTKYKFQVILTSKNGKIIQLDELRATTKGEIQAIIFHLELILSYLILIERKAIRQSEENISLMQSICGSELKQRIGFVGRKSSGKTSIITSIVSIFSRAYSITPGETTNRCVTTDVPLPNTNLTLAEFYGSSGQSETYINHVRNFIHGLIPENTTLNDFCAGR